MCISPLWNIRPPPIYPQLSHLHNHLLAILACITPFWNMRPPPVYPQSWPCHSTPFHLKRKFWRSDFSPQISSKFLESSRDGAQKRERENYWKRRRKKKRGRKKKLQESLQIKGKSIFWEEKNISTSKISFLMWFHFLPLHHVISKTLSKIIEKVFLSLFGRSFNLAI
jgi:hypothetical protein